MNGPLPVRRLTPADVDAFRALRLERLRLEDAHFRSALDDELRQEPERLAARLADEFVVGAEDVGQLVGMAGLTRENGAKLRHKALLWGMYLRREHRGTGTADALMRAVLNEARRIVETVLLTVVAANEPAVRFYERWGFVRYGLEPGSIKLADGRLVDEALMALRF